MKLAKALTIFIVLAWTIGCEDPYVKSVKEDRARLEARMEVLSTQFDRNREHLMVWESGEIVYEEWAYTREGKPYPAYAEYLWCKKQIELQQNVLRGYHYEKGAGVNVIKTESKN